MSEKLVTVGIALYNHEKFIVKCLESVVKQTYKNIEVIIVDNASSDGSIQNVQRKYPEFKYILNNKNVVLKSFVDLHLYVLYI